jgi:PEGA domain.
MKRTNLLLSALVLMSLVFTNCATIIHGSRQNISISSNPSKAVVVIDNVDKGMTPVTVRLTRKDHHTIQINLAGYLPYETKLTSKVDGWIVGNIVFGGLIGLAIDAASGSMYRLTPDQIQAELRNQSVSVVQAKDGIFLTVVMQPERDWQKVGQLERAN